MVDLQFKNHIPLICSFSLKMTKFFSLSFYQLYQFYQHYF